MEKLILFVASIPWWVLVIVWTLVTVKVIFETWGWYVMMARLHEMHIAGLLSPDRSLLVYRFAQVHAARFFVYDFLLMLLLAFPLLDVPRVWRGELLTTGFLSRHYNERPSFDVFKIWQPLHNLDMWYSMHVRKPFATWAGAALLDDVDPSGKHIK